MSEQLHHPLIARVLHWSWAVAILLLVLSGLYIHDPDWMPLFGAIGGMTTAKMIHFISMYVVIFVVIGRIYYAFASGDFKDLLVRPRDFLDMRRVGAYYLLLLKPKPDWGKYNPGQRLVYSFWVPLLIVQAITGFALYLMPTFDWATSLLGGLVYVRVIHFIVTWIFISTVTLHIYMGVIAGWSTFKSMITGRLE